MDVVSLASEFPNDNPALHRGVIWVVAEPTGAARPERSALPMVSAQQGRDALEGRELTAARVRSVEPDASSEATAAEATPVQRSDSTAREEVEVTEEPIEVAARKHESLAPPEDDEIDETAGPIVVEELEPIEASVEGELRDEDMHAATAPIEEAAILVRADESSVADAAPALAPQSRVDSDDATSQVDGAPAADETVASFVETSAEEAAPVAETSREEAAPVVETNAEDAAPATNTTVPEPLEPPPSVQRVEDANDLAELVAPTPAQSEVVLSGTRADAHEDDASTSPIRPIFDEVVAGDVPRETTSLPPAPDDPFTVLVCTLADVAIGAGAPHVAALLPGLLFDGRLPEPLDAGAAEALRSAGMWDGTEVAPSFVAVTAAWRAILRGTSDDFDACGAAMLDEWAAELLARLLAAPARAPMFRQELRSRGVAAFGLAA